MNDKIPFIKLKMSSRPIHQKERICYICNMSGAGGLFASLICPDWVKKLSWLRYPTRHTYGNAKWGYETVWRWDHSIAHLLWIKSMHLKGVRTTFPCHKECLPSNAKFWTIEHSSDVIGYHCRDAEEELMKSIIDEIEQ